MRVLMFDILHWFQIGQAALGKVNPHVHVEYEWQLRQEEIDESDDDLDEKVRHRMCNTDVIIFV